MRQDKGWNYEELGKRTGISVSYLNEIEKGKKYPQPENMTKIAAAFGITAEILASPVLSKNFAPVSELLQSNFLSELPLDLFGIELQNLVEIISRAPEKVGAFISAMLEIARNYSVQEENFYFAALRAYQEMRMNYFEEIEQAAVEFVALHKLPTLSAIPPERLAQILAAEYGVVVDRNGMPDNKLLQNFRSVFQVNTNKLLLHAGLNGAQRSFQKAKELGFQYLQIKERPYASSLVRVRSFEEVLNNFRAAYFAVAILVNKDRFVQDIQQFFAQKTWNPQYLIRMLQQYEVSPEVLFQRFNVLGRDFNLHKVFFIRIIHHLDTNSYEIDKELHLNQRHRPHATGLKEHYCRRWVVNALLGDMLAQPKAPNVAIQKATFHDTGETYLCLGVAKAANPVKERNIGIMLGILIEDQLKKTIRFWDDPQIPEVVVNVTCERCPIKDCAVRAAEPIILDKKEERKQIELALRDLIETKKT